MAVTKEEICSRALNKIGYGGINSFTDDNQRAAICADIWPTYSRYLLSIYDWYFIRAKAQLGRLITQPVNEYRYAFQLPGDYLVIHAVYESNNVHASPILEFDLFQNELYANSTAIWVDYRKYLIAEAWPYWFVQFVINALALELAEHIPTDETKMSKLQQKVWGSPSDNMKGGLFGFTANLDSKQRPSEPIQESPLITARWF